MSDDAINCWICGHAIDPGEKRRQIPMVSDDPRRPPTITGIACMGCYHGREQCYVPGASEGRLTSRLLHVPALAYVS